MKRLWCPDNRRFQFSAFGRDALLAVGASTLLALTLFVMFWNLGANSISISSDEVIYVRVSQGVLHEGSFFPLMHGNVPTFEKPPLKLWLGALAPWILGESDFSFRALDGLFGVLAVLGSVLLAWRVSRSVPGALALGFLVLAMPEWIIAQHGFRKVVLDGLLTVLTLGTAWAAWRAIENRESPRSRDLCLIGILSSLAVLTKSVAGFIPLACAVCSIGVVAPRALFTRRALWFALPFAVFLGYVFAVWEVGGMRGLRMFLGVEIVDRAFSGFDGHNTGSRWFYVWYIFIRGGAAPRVLAWVGVVGAVWAARRHLWARYALVWSALPVVAYSLSASRTPWYIAPFFPFVCMVAVFGTSALYDRLSARKMVRSIATLAILVTLYVSAGAYSRALARNIQEVVTDTRRLPIDILTERLRGEYTKFGVVESAVSARSNPRKGRFNVEGIYRETLKPDLLILSAISELQPESRRVYLVKEPSLSALPSGWVEVGRLAPSVLREWSVVAVVYP
jgi:4-amino-4-deoxy-L-arabinose transferase-like glycosyltransferase